MKYHIKQTKNKKNNIILKIQHGGGSVGPGQLAVIDGTMNLMSSHKFVTLSSGVLRLCSRKMI
uniref:Uncharacterized protein n=1 Tax=Astyanax mexicanus TaxID=7994 RepID=A0A8B9HZQ5_ASTMX